MRCLVLPCVLVLLAASARAGSPYTTPPPAAPFQPQILPPPPPPRIEIPPPPPPLAPTPRPTVRPPRAPTYFPGGMTMTATRRLHEDRDRNEARSTALIGRPRQAVDQLATCWSPPLPPKGETVEITIRFSFNGRGEVISPRVTYIKPTGSEAVRASLMEAIKTCSPLNFSKSMAASAPGYPLTVRFIGQRADD